MSDNSNYVVQLGSTDVVVLPFTLPVVGGSDGGGSGGSGEVDWGDIGGTLSSQTDLNSALTARALTTTTITAGTGLSGGGTLAANRTINLANTAVTAGDYTNANITVDAQGRITAAANGSGGSAAWGEITGTLSSQTDLQSALDAKTPTSRTVSAGTGLTGGGTLAADRSFALDSTNVAKLGTMTVTTDKVAIDRAVAPGVFDHTIAAGETDAPPAGSIFRSTVDGLVYHRLADGATNKLDNEVASEYGGGSLLLGRVVVAETTTGDGSTPEVQTVTVYGNGTYKIGDGTTQTTVASDASVATMQAAIDAAYPSGSPEFIAETTDATYPAGAVVNDKFVAFLLNEGSIPDVPSGWTGAAEGNVEVGSRVVYKTAVGGETGDAITGVTTVRIQLWRNVGTITAEINGGVTSIASVSGLTSGKTYGVFVVVYDSTYNSVETITDYTASATVVNARTFRREGLTGVTSVAPAGSLVDGGSDFLTSATVALEGPTDVSATVSGSAGAYVLTWDVNGARDLVTITDAVLEATPGTAAYADAAAFAAASHNHAADDINSGTFADARIAESNVTQHEDALTLVETPPIFLSPQDADAAAATNVVDFVIPFAFSLTSVEFRCREADPPTGSAAQLDVLLAGTTIFSTNPTIDASEFSSTTAATAPVLSSSPTALTAGQRLQFDLDQVGASNAGRGYYAILRGTRTNA